MRRLILFRHAKAEPRAPGGEDFDRSLAARGRTDAALMGRVLAREKLSPDLALVSTARRAVETWDEARKAFPDARTETREAIYNASAEEILAEVERVAAGAETVMVVGHNPGLHELAVDLLIRGSASDSQIDTMAARFPTATAASMLIDEDMRASWDGLFLARDYGGEGEG